MDKKPEIYRLLFLYRAKIPSITGLHQLFEYLMTSRKMDYRYRQEMKITNADIDWADIIVLGRFDSWYEFHLTEQLSNTKDLIVYYIDDDLLNVPSNIRSSIYYGREDIKEYISKCISLSNAILSPSSLLLDKYSTDNKERFLFQSAVVLPMQYLSRKEGEKVKIGFAGSLDRADDITKILSEALIKVKNRYGAKVQFEFFGAIPDISEKLEAKVIPFIADYNKYRETLNHLEWDIGLAPMPNTLFHACKNYNKYIEYASSAIAGIYSDCEPYTRIPNRDRIGRFCQNTSDEWYEAICKEVDDFHTRELHRKMANADVIRNHALPKVSDELYQSLLPIFRKGRENKEEEHRINLLRLKTGNIWFRGNGYIRQYGKRAPKAIAKKIIDIIKSRSV